MIRPKFQPIFEGKSDFCEQSDSKPVETFVPNQAISLSELISRFERGQRLNVHTNFRVGSNLEDLTDEEALQRIREESLDSDDFPPDDVHDIVDVQREKELHDVHKREFHERVKRNKEEAKQAPKAKQASDDTLPPPDNE